MDSDQPALNSSSARPRARRDDILTAAALLLAERGSPEQVSMDAIAFRAGVAKATVYSHFASKAVLMRCVADTGVALQPIEARRDRILGAALRCFGRYGFRGATIDIIAEEAGVASSSIYTHFASKEDLIGALMEEYSPLPHLRELVEAPLDGDSASFRAIAQAMHLALEERIDLIRMVLTESADYPEFARQFYRDLVTRVWGELAKYIDRRVEAGLFRPGYGLLRAQALAGMVLMYTLAKRNFGDDVLPPWDEASDEFLTILLDGLRVRPDSAAEKADMDSSRGDRS